MRGPAATRRGDASERTSVVPCSGDAVLRADSVGTPGYATFANRRDIHVHRSGCHRPHPGHRPHTHAVARAKHHLNSQRRPHRARTTSSSCSVRRVDRGRQPVVATPVSDYFPRRGSGRMRLRSHSTTLDMPEHLSGNHRVATHSDDATRPACKTRSMSSGESSRREIRGGEPVRRRRARPASSPLQDARQLATCRGLCP